MRLINVTNKSTFLAGDPGKLYRRRSQTLSRFPAAWMCFPHRRFPRTTEHRLEASCCPRFPQRCCARTTLGGTALCTHRNRSIPGSLPHRAGCPCHWEVFHNIQPLFPSCLLNQLSLVLLTTEMEKKASRPSFWHCPPVPDQRPSPSPVLHRSEVLVTGSGPLQSLPKQPQRPGEWF